MQTPRHAARRSWATAALVSLLVAVFLLLGCSLAFAAPLGAGTRFTESVPLNDTGSVACGFQVISGNTVMVVGDQTMRGARAVDRTTTGSLTIPQTITHLGESYTVTRIGDYAFGGDAASNSCNQLTQVNLPVSLQQIGTRAFAFNEALTSISFPALLNTIDGYAFYNCSSLTVLDFPAGVTNIRSYAFSRCSGLNTVIFRGNAPSTGAYVFTGAGVRIQKVIYYGRKLVGQESLFNSAAVAPPEYFYTIRFFVNQLAVSTGSPIGTATVSGSVDFLDIRAGLESQAVYTGAIPAFPGTTNFWLFQGNPSLNAKLTDSCYAYALFSNFNNLALGQLRVDDQIFTGRPVAHGAVVSDILGTRLTEGRHFTFRFYRQGAGPSGQWEETTDTATPGTIRITATGTGALYQGSIASTFTISLSTRAFFYEIPLTSTTGVVSTVPCSFRIISRNGETGTVAVTQPELEDAVTPGLPRAVPPLTDGFITIPETLVIGPYRFSVTSIEESSLAGCSYLRGVTIPRSVVSVGAAAFSDCTRMRRVVFEGDASGIVFGNGVFASTWTTASGVDQVVYLGKKETVYGLFNIDRPPYRYFTITFYDRQENVGNPAGRLGSVTINERLKLAAVPTLTTPYAGAVPPYPDWIVDDGEWFAPTWVYPEVNNDNQLAMRSTLSDSTYAYAAQTNDIFTIADAIVIGLEDNAEFGYSGVPQLDPAGVAVYNVTGGKLTLGTHYTQSFEREEAADSWVPTTDFTNPGNLRLILRGLNGYSGTQYLRFSIVNRPGSPGSLIMVPVPNVLSDGTETTVPCQFRILSVADGKLEVEVYATPPAMHTQTRYDNPALPRGVTGKVTIPSTIRYNELSYAVVGMSSFAFGNGSATDNACRYLEELVLPSSLRSIGQNALSYLTRLRSATIPSGITAETVGGLAGDSALQSVTLGGSINVLPENIFSGCSSLTRIDLPIGLSAIKTGAFANCTALQSVQLPPVLTDYAGAFTNCRQLKEVIFPAGMTTVSDRAFQGCSALESIDLPDTITSIGDLAFAGTGIKELALGPNIKTLGSNAFSSCSSLQTVIFEGDASAVTAAVPFSSSTAIRKVVFMDRALYGFELLFPASAEFYVAVTFYESADALAAQTPLGKAVVRRGTILRTIRSDRLPAASLFSGEVPLLPGDTTLWQFEGGPALSSVLENACYAFAVAADLKDLGYGKVICLEGYRYTGEEINPFSFGSGQVIDPDGLRLDPALYTLGFQRLDADGVWQDSADLSSVGAVRVTATATGADGYHGTAEGLFTIAEYMRGDSFVHADMNGNSLTYVVTAIANELVPGTVQVGFTSNLPAVPTDTAGVVVIPEFAKDPRGFSYAPTLITNNAFYRCLGVTGVVIPSKVTRIGNNAFAYAYQSGDITMSNLATVVFKNDLSRTTFGTDVFAGCNAIRTIIYGDKKGSFSSFGASRNITRYYTARFYGSAEGLAAADALATLTIKEGSTVDSPSPTDYYTGSTYYPTSETLPALPAQAAWRFEPGTLGTGRAITDSLYVFARELQENVIVADVSVTAGATTSTVPCSFTILLDENDQPTTQVQVGTGIEGQTALDSSTLGVVHIPATITDGGVTYEVTRVGEFAFGSTEPGEAAIIGGVELPATVTSIERAAFMNCANLTDVAFSPDGVLTQIKAFAFASTPALRQISLPANLEGVGDAAFMQSGLRAVRLPATVTQLGKRAFMGNTQLVEAIFDGVMNLDLPSLDGLPPATVTGTSPEQTEPGEPQTASRLTVLDDYLFANCTALRRLSFNADVYLLEVSPYAFEGASALEAVVYGDRKNTISFPNATPQNYVTVSYFESLDAQNARMRQSYLCVRQGAVLDQMSGDDIYAGARPGAPTEFEWSYARSTASPLTDYCFAYLRRTGYDLNTAAVDGAFAIRAEVGGEARDVAALGEYVRVVLEQRGAAVSTRLLVTSDADGSVLVDTTATEAAFLMPNSPVTFRVDAALELEVYRQTLTGQPTLMASLSLDDLGGLLRTDTVSFSAFDYLARRSVTTTDSYLSLTELLSAYGISFESGDSLAFKRANGGVEAISYNGFMGWERYWYPNLAAGSTGGGTVIAPVLALRTNERAVAPGETEPGESNGPLSMRDGWQLLYGQTPAELVGRLDTKSGFTSQVVSITVINGAQKLSDCTVEGIEPYYAYTGEAIRPLPVLTDSDGRELVLDQDYSLSYRDDKGPGIAHMALEGLARYKGELDVPYRIVRAQALAGDTREQTAAAIALDAYPQGSDGVILADSGGFADALSASGLAGALDYPLVLTEGSTLGAPASEVIKSLAGERTGFEVILAGGTGSLSAQVETDVMMLLRSQGFTTRIAGADRYETSREVFFHGLMTAGWSSKMVVASGLEYADALAISPYAANAPAPIFLCDGTDLGDEAIEDMRLGGFTSALIVGGEGSVSPGVLTQLETIVGTGAVLRLGGATRYDTAFAIAQWELASGGLVTHGAAITTGLNFPDALAGGALLGKSASILLLVDESNTGNLAILAQNRDVTHHLRFLGGTGTVPQTVREMALDTLQWDRRLLP